MKRLRVSEPAPVHTTESSLRDFCWNSTVLDWIEPPLVFVVSRSRPKIADSRVHPAARKYSPLQLIGPFVPFFLARYHNGSNGKYFEALGNFLCLYQLRKISWNLVRDTTIATTFVKFDTDLKLYIRVTGRSTFIANVHLQITEMYQKCTSASTLVQRRCTRVASCGDHLFPKLLSRRQPQP